MMTLAFKILFGNRNIMCLIKTLAMLLAFGFGMIAVGLLREKLEKLRKFDWPTPIVIMFFVAAYFFPFALAMVVSINFPGYCDDDGGCNPAPDGRGGYYGC